MVQQRMVVLAWLVATLAVPASALAQSADPNLAAIMRASRVFSAAYVANDTAALGRVYTDSAVLLPSDREVRGRPAIQRYFAWGPNRRQIAHAMKSESITINGDMAVDVGTWTSTSQRGDAPAATASGRYMVVWVRESDGAWRMLYDMWHRPTQ